MADRTRRRVLASTGALTLTALAGCGDVGLSGGDTDDEQVDRTGETTVDVLVGAGNGFEYDPAHIRIDTGTTVVWEWTGDGGGHDVYEITEAFESELTAEAGFTFEHTFDEPGTFEYVCTPHQSQGMDGVVDVIE